MTCRAPLARAELGAVVAAVVRFMFTAAALTPCMPRPETELLAGLVPRPEAEILPGLMTKPEAGLLAKAGPAGSWRLAATALAE